MRRQREAQLAQERRAFADCVGTDDFAEGRKAFLGRNKAIFLSGNELGVESFFSAYTC
jgi:hypothetical protein